MTKTEYITIMGEALGRIDAFEKSVLSGKKGVSIVTLKKVCRMRAVVLKACNDVTAHDKYQSPKFCKALSDEVIYSLNELNK